MKQGSPTNMRFKIPKVPAGTPTTAVSIDSSICMPRIN